MELPILSKELRLTLRQRRTFTSAFFFYSVLVFAMTMAWTFGLQEGSPLLVNREAFSQILFALVIGVGYVLLCPQACLTASKMMVSERETNSANLLYTAPVRAWRFTAEKMLSPLFVSFLLFFGILPVVSIIFILGGLDPWTFFYQLMNLAVWINSSILVGLWVSSRARSATRAVAGALCLLVGLAFLVPNIGSLSSLTAEILKFLGTKHNLPWLWEGAKMLKMLADDYLVYLHAISPDWMIASWYAPIYPMFPFDGGAAAGVFPTCPALLSWLMHLEIGTGLFWGAARGWKKTRKRDAGGGKAGVPGLWARLRYARPGRGLFPENWWAIARREDRELFKQGVWSKSIFIGTVVLLMVILYSQVPKNVLRDVSVVVTVFSIIIMHLIVLVFASGSMRRERAKGTTGFLLLAPVEARSILLGKWVYYHLFGCSIFALVFLPTLFFYVFYSVPLPSWRSGELLTHVIIVCILLAFLPLLSLLGLYSGMQRRWWLRRLLEGGSGGLM